MLKTFYDFLIRHFKKNVKSHFFKSEKKNIKYVFSNTDSNHGAISYHFRDKWRFWSKITNFPRPPVYFAPPPKGFPLVFDHVVATGTRKKFDDIFTKIQQDDPVTPVSSIRNKTSEIRIVDIRKQTCQS